MNEHTLKEAVVQARHDLRNPVSHILGFAEMLLPGTEGEFREMLEEICRSGNAIVALINEHLNWPHPGNVAVLQAQLSDPGNRILALAQGAFSLPSAEGDVADDLVRITQAAKELSATFGNGTPPLEVMLKDLCQMENKEGQKAAEAKTPGSESVSATPYSVLVVDDLAEIRYLLQARLSELGYTVHLAASGPEALSLLNTTAVDVILLDIGMPGVDGIEVLRQLKADEKTKPIPVLMLTFSESPEQLALCLKLGAEGSLSKPFKDVLLQASLHTALARTRTG